MSYKNDNLNNEFLSEKEQIELYNDLAFFGYLLPTNETELDEFEKIYGTTQTILPKKFESPNFLKNKKITKKANIAVSSEKKDYFKKMVLAAEITSELYSENTFGHKKFVKVLYLCEEVCSMNLSTKRPLSSGPRCWIAATARSNDSTSPLPNSKELAKPTKPHIKFST